MQQSANLVSVYGDPMCGVNPCPNSEAHPGPAVKMWIRGGTSGISEFIRPLPDTRRC
jgi:hypothetical protein